MLACRRNIAQFAKKHFSTSSVASSVRIEIVKEGDGKTFPKRGQTVTMHYIGTLAASGA